MPLVFHPDTLVLIDKLKHSLPQGVLLKGQIGVGLLTVARQIAGKNLVNMVTPTDKDGNATSDGSGEIRITQIRELTTQLRGKSTTRRVVIIDDADKMNRPAQQAFLKLLEEPTANTHFLLTAHNFHVILPTILSRVQPLIVKPVTREQSTKLISAAKEYDPRRTQQLLFLADGRPAELTRLLSDSEYFARQVTAVEDARQFIGGEQSARAAIAQKYHSDRLGALLMLEQSLRIIRATLKSRPDPKLVASADRLTTTYERVSRNGNIRLQLLNFVVQ